jgi:DNA-directed RNA polymerase sigma subunit (sigma70/sigma32)
MPGNSKRWNDERLDELHRTDVEKEFTVAEIAAAAGVPRQTIYDIEKRALRKLREELIRRGLTA